MKIVFDCGSTKTSLAIISTDRHAIHSDLAPGFNASTGAEEELVSILHICNEAVIRPAATVIDEIHFYGAGCATPDICGRVKGCISGFFPGAELGVYSDMLGAARAVCGHSPGIVGILGTGSNSCVYDGREIVANVSPLGYILGDEGSGAVLGRMFLGMLLKNRFPQKIRKDFEEEFHLSVPDIIERVYRTPRANAFLASFCPFILRHSEVNEVAEFLHAEFSRFVTYNLCNYTEFPQLPVHLVGSVALHFHKFIDAAILARGGHTGNVTNTPITPLALYHK